MSYKKTIICLANSRKISGRCVAGLELTNDGAAAWTRPVSSRPDGELSDDDRRYKNGEKVQVLDRVSIIFKEPKPHAFQPENHLIDDKYYWARIGTASFQEVAALVEDESAPLWIDDHSTYHGQNDKIPVDQCPALGSSLRLIRPAITEIWVGTESGFGCNPGKRPVRALFDWAGSHYKLKVTDPKIEAKFLAGKDGSYELDNAVLCVSLGEEYQGHSFKLVATVIIE